MFNTPNVFDKSCFTGTLSDFWPQKQTMKTAEAQIFTAYPSLCLDGIKISFEDVDSHAKCIDFHIPYLKVQKVKLPWP